MEKVTLLKFLRTTQQQRPRMSMLNGNYCKGKSTEATKNPNWNCLYLHLLRLSFDILIDFFLHENSEEKLFTTSNSLHQKDSLEKLKMDFGNWKKKLDSEPGHGESTYKNHMICVSIRCFWPPIRSRSDKSKRWTWCTLYKLRLHIKIGENLNKIVISKPPILNIFVDVEVSWKKSKFACDLRLATFF